MPPLVQHTHAKGIFGNLCESCMEMGRIGDFHRSTSRVAVPANSSSSIKFISGDVREKDQTTRTLPAIADRLTNPRSP